MSSDAKQSSEDLTERFRDIAERSQRIAAEFVARQSEGGQDLANPDPLGIGRAFLEMSSQLMREPARLATAQTELARQYAQLWRNAARSMRGRPRRRPWSRPRETSASRIRLGTRISSSTSSSSPTCSRPGSCLTTRVRPKGRKAAPRRRPHSIRGSSSTRWRRPIPCDQPEGAARDGRDQWRKPGAGLREPAARPRGRQGPAADRPNRHGCVRGRAEHCSYTGQGGPPQRPDGADPIPSPSARASIGPRC